MWNFQQSSGRIRFWTSKHWVYCDHLSSLESDLSSVTNLKLDFCCLIKSNEPFRRTESHFSPYLCTSGLSQSFLKQFSFSCGPTKTELKQGRKVVSLIEIEKGFYSWAFSSFYLIWAFQWKWIAELLIQWCGEKCRFTWWLILPWNLKDSSTNIVPFVFLEQTRERVMTFTGN